MYFKTPKSLFMKSVYFFVIILFTFAFISCKSKALVSCVNVEHYQSASGIVNLPQVGIGDVFLIDTVTKITSYMGHVNVLAASLNTDQPPRDIDVLITATFSISFTGKIEKADKGVQAGLESTIGNSTIFHLKNSYRTSDIDPGKSINKATFINSIRDAYNNNNNLVFGYVSALVYADTFNLMIKQQQGYANEVNVVHQGGYKVKVNYNCEGNLHIDSKKAGMFFKVSTYKFDPKDSKLTQLETADLRRFDFTHTKD